MSLFLPNVWFFPGSQLSFSHFESWWELLTHLPSLELDCLYLETGVLRYKEKAKLIWWTATKMHFRVSEICQVVLCFYGLCWNTEFQEARGPWPTSVLWRGLWPPGPLERSSFATALVCFSSASLNLHLWGMTASARRKGGKLQHPSCLCPDSSCPLGLVFFGVGDQPSPSFPFFLQS